MRGVIIMTKADVLYELAKQLPEAQVQQLIEFAQGFQTLPYTPTKKPIPVGTLTGLLGIAKSENLALSDQDLQDQYADYLIQKYQ